MRRNVKNGNSSQVRAECTQWLWHLRQQHRQEIWKQWWIFVGNESYIPPLNEFETNQKHTRMPSSSLTLRMIFTQISGTFGNSGCSMQISRRILMTLLRTLIPVSCRGSISEFILQLTRHSSPHCKSKLVLFIHHTLRKHYENILPQVLKKKYWRFLRIKMSLLLGSYIWGFYWWF